jgi:hypothetical protein
LDSLAKLLAWASTHYGISTDTLAAHRDYAATACPGRSVYARLKDGSLRQAVDAARAGGPIELVLLDAAAGAARVRAIQAQPPRSTETEVPSVGRPNLPPASIVP